MATIQKKTLLTTSSLFQKRPLVFTVKSWLMLHQEIKLKYPQIKAPSHRIAARVKCQNLLVIKVCNNMICFSSYCLLVHLKWKVIVNLLKAAKGIVSLTLYQCHSSLIAIFNRFKTRRHLGLTNTANRGTGLYSLKRRGLNKGTEKRATKNVQFV